MIKIHDFEKCELSDRNGTYGGMAGLKEGVLIDNEYWLIKYPKNVKSVSTIDVSYTTSSLSEFLGSNIYHILGYDVHKTFLGLRNGKLVVACKDFCRQPGALREIRTLKNVYNKDLEYALNTSLHSTDSNHLVDLHEILLHLEYNPILNSVPGIKERFWDCVIIDGLINNNDRNNGNWGVLYEDGSYHLAPIFGNGGSFNDKVSDSRLDYLLTDSTKLLNSVLNTTTIYGVNGKKVTYRDILKLDYPDLRNSLKKLVPLIGARLSDIQDLIYSVPQEYNGLTVCSGTRKEFYYSSIEERYNRILLSSKDSVRRLSLF